MRIIAVEEHFGLPEISAAGAPEQERLCPYFHQAYAGCPGLPHVPAPGTMQDLADKRLADMDAAGIDVQILSSNSTQLILSPDAPDICRRANDALASAVSRNPKRLFAFASLPTAQPDAAARELERMILEEK